MKQVCCFTHLLKSFISPGCSGEGFLSSKCCFRDFSTLTRHITREKHWICFLAWNICQSNFKPTLGQLEKIGKNESLMLGSGSVLSSVGFKHEGLRLNSWSWTFFFVGLRVLPWLGWVWGISLKTCRPGGLENLNCASVHCKSLWQTKSLTW